MTNRNQMLLVKLSSIVDAPSASRLRDMTTRPPYRSYSRPRNGCVTPFTRMPTDTTADMVVRSHENSSVIGRMKTPNVLREPVDTNSAKKPAASTNHP